MRIDKIVIENYRSVKDVTLYPSGIMALVGPNNSGKTNILCALNFLLGDRWPSANGLEATDRYNKDSGNKIKIAVYFSSKHNNPDGVAAIAVYEDQTGRLNARYKRFGSDQYHFLNDAIRSQFPVVYLDAARSFDQQFSMSKWSLFGRIARQLHEDFENNATAEAKQALTHHLVEAQGLLKTPLYVNFERAISEAFQDQIRRTIHAVRLDFRSFDPLNFYRAIHPVIVDGGHDKSPTEAGSGVRNLIVLALFRAYATAFRSSTVFVIEEPEIYLHPHAQRSLATLFRELTAADHQVFYSTHSAAFVDVTQPHQIVLVERCNDDDEDVCTQIKDVREDHLIEARRRLHPTFQMTAESIRERLGNLCAAKHAEAFFARAILLGEGPTEQEVFPIFGRHLGVDFDALDISCVGAEGKANLDMFWQLYTGHRIPTYLVFDNDAGGRPENLRPNEILTRMLNLPEQLNPPAIVADTYAIISGDLENVLQTEVDETHPGLYASLAAEARQALGLTRVGQGKPLVARYVAKKLVAQNIVPPTIREIVEAVRRLAER